MGLSGALIQLFAAHVGENLFSVPRVLCDETFHFGDGCSLGICIVECESHSNQNAPLETLPRVRLQGLRIFICAAVEKERSDALHRLAVQ